MYGVVHEPGFKIGSSDAAGGHLRNTDGWPFSIYRQAWAVGVTDVVLCEGIQNLDDAKSLLAMCNGTIRPSLKPLQMFAWD